MNPHDKEYECLRKAIESYLSKTDLMTNILYISVTAILAWAMECQNPFICTAVFCIIVPTFIVAQSYNIATLKIGAYFIVFYDEFKWEERLNQIDLNTRGKFNHLSASFKFPYIFVGILSAILSWIIFWGDKINWNNIMMYANNCFNTIIATIFAIVVIKQKNNIDIKQVYIEEWKEIKKSETNDSQINN